MSKIITVAECLRIMESHVPFSCLVVTYDRNRKKGGKLLEIPEARLDRKAGPDCHLPTDELPNAPRPMTDYEAKRHALTEPADGSKNPNHKQWYTRNIRPYAAGHPLTDLVKIHPPLLIEFNGKTVVP